MHDAGHLGLVQAAAGVQGQQHRGAGLLLLAEETVLVGQGQVHAGGLHRRERLDGAGELAFEAALEGQPLLELGHAETAGLHQFEAIDRALGQALRGQAQAHIVHLVGRHHDGAAALGVAVGHLHLRELGHDGAAILVAQVGVEHAHLGRAAHEEQGQRDHHQRQGAQAQLGLLGGVQPCQARAESIAVNRLEFDVGNSGAHGRGLEVRSRAGTTPLVRSIIRGHPPRHSGEKGRLCPLIPGALRSPRP